MKIKINKSLNYIISNNEFYIILDEKFMNSFFPENPSIQNLLNDDDISSVIEYPIGEQIPCFPISIINTSELDNNQTVLYLDILPDLDSYIHFTYWSCTTNTMYKNGHIKDDYGSWISNFPVNTVKEQLKDDCVIDINKKYRLYVHVEAAKSNDADNFLKPLIDMLFFNKRKFNPFVDKNTNEFKIDKRGIFKTNIDKYPITCKTNVDDNIIKEIYITKKDIDNPIVFEHKYNKGHFTVEYYFKLEEIE